jgi:hypothetical protein
VSEAWFGRQSSKTGGGSTFEVGSRKRMDRVGTRRGKALRAEQSASFDEGAVVSVLAGGAARGFDPWKRISRQEASEVRSFSTCAVENTATEGRRARGSSIGKPTRNARRPFARQMTGMDVKDRAPKLAMHRQVQRYSSRPLGPWFQRT